MRKCVWMSWRKSFFLLFLFSVHLSIEPSWQTCRRTKKGRKKRVVNQSWSKQWLLFIGRISYALQSKRWWRRQYHNCVYVNKSTVAYPPGHNREKYPFGRPLIVLKQTNNEIVASKIDQHQKRLQRTKTTHKSWVHRHVIEMIVALFYGRLEKRVERNRDREREIWNAVTVAKCKNLSSKHRKKDANDVTFEAKGRKVEKRADDNDHAWCVFERHTHSNTHEHMHATTRHDATINRTKNKRVTSFTT